MTPRRPKALKWIGDNLPDGRPVEFIQTVEPRDHDEDETAALTQEQLSAVRHSGLYREVAFPAAKDTKAKAKQEPEAEPVAEPEPDNAGEPAQESEG
jgi:hypothetical protein